MFLIFCRLLSCMDFIFMKKIAFLLLFVANISFGQQLSEKATISIITCGPWQGELYSAFGHSAFRVYDPEQQIDEAYNYGVFDFDQPNFYLNFARGYLYYKLGVYSYPRFRDYYIYHNRFIHEQVLQLTPAQKQKLYDYLLWNAQPENANYRYDYFYNNCATKIRDVLIHVYGDSLTIDGSYIQTDYTIRKLTDIYLQQQPWGDLGIDICLGIPMDKTAAPSEYMFLPDYIESSMDHATLKNDSSTLPLVKEKIVVYESRFESPPKGLPHPALIFGIVAACVLALTVWDVKRKKLSLWLDFVLFEVIGLVGVLLLLLWIATDHQAAARNFNLLWALPTHALVAFTLMKTRRWHSAYFLITSVICLLTLACWIILPQQLNTSLIPMVIIILTRSAVWFRLS